MPIAEPIAEPATAPGIEPVARRPVPRARFLLQGLLWLAMPWITGCSVATASNPFAARSAGAQEIQIVVESTTFNDVTIWAISQSRRVRLGRVGGMADSRFTMEWDHVEQLSLRIDMLAGQTYTTPAITVSAGERVLLRVRDPVSSSMVTRSSR